MKLALKGESTLIAAGVMIVTLSLSSGIVFAQPPGGPPGKGNSLQNRVAALEGEVTALQGQVATLEGLVQGLLAADGVLQGNIDAEAAARAAADAALQAGIDTEASARIAGDDAEASARAMADGFLQLQIDEFEDAGSDLAGFVTVNPDPMNGLAGPHIIFEGANVHIQSGSGATNDGWEEADPPPAGALFGLGNLVVGYNEDTGVIAARTGSHNLVVGPEHTYSNYGGFVAGLANAVTGRNASVSGGGGGEARGDSASVSGGGGGEAIGDSASVSGGRDNRAIGDYSSVSGGGNDVGPPNNIASGRYSSISGGQNNQALGYNSWIGGGLTNEAGIDGTTTEGRHASVAGGVFNKALGNTHTICGGQGNLTGGLVGVTWAGGDLNCGNTVATGSFCVSTVPFGTP